ncbi:MAG: hypothetical protein ACR2HJ_02475 [Fimbriimonadales bacterium]
MSVSEAAGSRALALVRSIAVADACVPALIAGEEGAGQSGLSRSLAGSFLCLQPQDGVPCGECQACVSAARDVCPDLLLVEPGGRSDLILLGQIVLDKRNPQPHIREFIQAPPVVARTKVVLIERAERFNADAANALLKMLEEPPEWARFILTADAASRIIPTIRSRCLLVPCDFAEAELGFLSTISGGAAELAAKLSQLRLAPFLEQFEGWLSALPGRKRIEALKVSEEFQELADLYREDDDSRFARAEVVKLFANWLAANARSDILHGALEMHRAVLGNVNFGYLCDSFFAESHQP